VTQECHINIKNTRNNYVTVIQETSMYYIQDVKGILEQSEHATYEYIKLVI